MKKAKLIIDGKEIEIVIPQEQFDKLFPQKKKTGYERVDDEEHYYYMGYDGRIKLELENDNHSNKVSYEAANYYSNKTIAENNARADKLMRQLRRFAVEHRKKPIDWIDTRNSPWVFTILGDPLTKRLSVKKDGCGIKQFGTIYFDTKETAQLAIDTFKDELLWYFTEYKDAL